MNDYAEYMQDAQRRALELMKGQSPYFNIAPVIELVIKADSLGLNLVKKPLKPAHSRGATYV